VYLLDTDHVSLLLTGHPKVTARIAEKPEADIWVSPVTVEEMMRGRLAEVNAVREGKSRSTMEAAYALFLADMAMALRFQILPYTNNAEELYRAFPAAVKRVGKQDCRIAALALVAGFAVVTRNSVHYSQIPGLSIEDWTV
jgi:tRNA(fMet)-specific endonuclease VapC